MGLIAMKIIILIFQQTDIMFFVLNNSVSFFILIWPIWPRHFLERWDSCLKNQLQFLKKVLLFYFVLLFKKTVECTINTMKEGINNCWSIIYIHSRLSRESSVHLTVNVLYQIIHLYTGQFSYLHVCFSFNHHRKSSNEHVLSLSSCLSYNNTCTLIASPYLSLLSFLKRSTHELLNIQVFMTDRYKIAINFATDSTRFSPSLLI